MNTRDRYRWILRNKGMLTRRELDTAIKDLQIAHIMLTAQVAGKAGFYFDGIIVIDLTRLRRK